ncbi:hypothetical protein ASF69_01620 [Rhizobium sp. Leaf311]|uniref:Shedu immune nuclease family protein n=1 Tax=Rhizobium sp. Leaf311 TaxID=1736332 RepID=UPI000714E091|nr:Shedu immune nuclease family protein [Rhizobium sp. Leaf311]KQQ61148.1 hypothetical protein ASF69_01620 [Rhizobium sp. Leaf311]
MVPLEEPTVKQVQVRTEDGSAISLYQYGDGRQVLKIKVTDKVRKHVFDQENSHVFQSGTHEILLAEYEPKHELLITYPTTLLPQSPYFGTDKYLLVQRISLERARPLWDHEEDNSIVGSLHRQFPSGFVCDPFDGFGLIFMLRFIVDAIEEITEVEEIRLCKDKTTSFSNGIFRLPISMYERMRKTLNRTHRAAVEFANEEKRAFLRSDLVLPYLPDHSGKPVFRRTKADLKAVLGSAINSPGRRSQTHPTNESAAVRVVKSSAKELIAENREEILELNREIELVTLEDVISKFEARLADRSLKEGSWQKFLSVNPFILRLAFGLPAVVFKEQMPVGGWDFDNKGGKLADFVMKSGAVGNLAIVEIKTPEAKLLGKTAYRGGIHAPSSGIAGAVTQVLDQRYLLQDHISQLLRNSQEEAHTYAVGCIVIIGTTPTVESYKKSFELYRNNLNGVVVITFDELLDKLKALHAFLVEPPIEDAAEDDDVSEINHYDFDLDEDEDGDE